MTLSTRGLIFVKWKRMGELLPTAVPPSFAFYCVFINNLVR
ncbi:hypothetical protein KKC1_23140 [Calderihabitans maritimus]|uniref:Uncharacterized protein n=1 Tax=Calderihabitans maritimus TaxID=1246530 RepID=A0A1Z5HUH6_9FIRM|nr:hypothetical protein KKC1_23140 [Calderihabitans maritimus]